MKLNVIDDVESKVQRLEARLRVVDKQTEEISKVTGRVLAQPIENFRDSPPLDVSAMDGYAFGWDDLSKLASQENMGRLTLPVAAVATAGSKPLTIGSEVAVRIFTGGVVPLGAQVVIPRERCIEDPDRVAVNMPIQQIKLGWNIRRQGENARQGETGLQPGCLIDGPRMSSLVSMNRDSLIEVYRKLRVTIINTGDELMQVADPIEPWQIRDSNGPLLESMLESCPWVQWDRVSAKDDLQEIQRELEKALDRSDAVILTGGVSMGDTDHVPAAVRNSQAEVLFHRLPIRPGAPILGSATPDGQLVLGLPGNPVSVAVTFRRFGLQLLRRMAGFSNGPKFMKLDLTAGDEKTLHLVWYRLVELQHDGTVKLVTNQGSGDIRALGVSSGFIEVPPETVSKGQFPYFDWSL
jgi:molybdopterin molybdotransferase